MREQNICPELTRTISDLNAKKQRQNGEKVLAFSPFICYINSAIRTEADFPHVAERLGGRVEASGGLKQKKENIKWQSYP